MKGILWIGLVIIMIATGVTGQFLTDRQKAEVKYQELIEAVPITSLNYDVVKNVIVEGDHYIRICYNITVEFDYLNEFNSCENLPVDITKDELDFFLNKKLNSFVESTRPLDISYPTDRSDLNAK